MASDPVVLANIHLLLEKQHLPSSSKELSAPSLLRTAGRLLFRGGGCGRSAGRRREMLNYLKPGALAQFRDAHIRKSMGCSSRKRKAFESVYSSVSEAQSSDGVYQVSETIFPPEEFRSFGPSYPQRKKLLASKGSFVSVPHANATALPLSSASSRSVQKSSLDSLPFNLLVNVLSKLKSDDLKSAFFVSRRLRETVIKLTKTT